LAKQPEHAKSSPARFTWKAATETMCYVWLTACARTEFDLTLRCNTDRKSCDPGCKLPPKVQLWSSFDFYGASVTQNTTPAPEISQIETWLRACMAACSVHCCSVTGVTGVAVRMHRVLSDKVAAVFVM